MGQKEPPTLVTRAAGTPQIPDAPAGGRHLRYGPQAEVLKPRALMLRDFRWVPTMSEFDLAAHVELSRRGPCFVCAYLSSTLHILEWFGSGANREDRFCIDDVEGFV